MGLVDSGNNIVVKYKYDAWGKPTLKRSLTTAYDALATLNPFRYRGHVYDEETALYDLRSRYYNPVCGRFVPSGRYTVRALANDVTLEGSVGGGGTAAIGIGLAKGLANLGRRVLGWLGILAGPTVVASTAGTTSVADQASSAERPSSTVKEKEPKRDEAKYYLAVAYGGGSPILVRPALTSQEVYTILHVAKATDVIQSYVDDVHPNLGTPVAYGA